MFNVFYSANPNNITSADKSYGKRWKIGISYNGEVHIQGYVTKPTSKQIRIAKKSAIKAIKELL